MANYRFKAAEIEAMKKNILTHIEREAETKTAWRLRCAIEGQLMCCRPSKREAARLERELALYEKLTKNDLPNWQHDPTQPATPTETPQISTESAETVNVSAEGEKGAEKAIYAFISKAETILDKIKQKCLNREIYVEDASRYEFMVCMAVSNFVNKHKNCPTEPPQSPEIPQETAEPANVSAEEGNEAIKHISEIMETCRTWDNEKRDYTDEYKYYTWLANHIPEHENTNKNVTEIVLEEVRERIATAATLVAHGVPKCDMEGAVCAVVNRLAKMEDILRFYDAIEPPQSPTTSTDIQTIKPQEKRAQTARKEPKRTIQISLIVQRPQSVVRNLRTSLSYHFREVTKMVVPRLVKNVPRECSTADAVYW